MNTSRTIEKALFDAARNIEDPGTRRAFLEQACGDDRSLRDRVESLLEVEDRAEEFFRAGAIARSARLAEVEAVSDTHTSSNGEPDDATDFIEGPGAQIGRYKLIERIGEGGCGVVYMAEQFEPVRRRVALKIIRPGMDSESVIARFEAERQALALMDHPGIARVFDAGATANGRPFVVMELVRGVKITDYCNQHQLDTAQRLELFIRVCHAIQHAHQKGVIHRDIKPSNILVALHDGVAIPKVIDFGIAKATEGRLTDDTIFTAHDQFVGTPAYMSPEQAEYSGLDVDTRSDIYSLGVLLYELLTSRTPFDRRKLMQSGVDEIRRTLREREPVAPSTLLTSLDQDELTRLAEQRRAEPPRLVHSLRGDLDWIVMKALEKERQRRYETAEALAMDVRRHLNNEPVLARPPGRYYRFQKLVRRNRIVFAAVTAVALALVAGLSLSTWLFLREREARRRAVDAEQQQVRLREVAERLRDEAENRRKLTEATVYLSRDLMEEADALILQIPDPHPSLEYAGTFRALGDWHSIHHRWHQAAERFAVLVKINQPENWDNATLDYLRYGPVLIELGDRRGYEEFRQSAVAFYSGTTNPLAAERVVKISLLLPAPDELLSALEPLAEIASESLQSRNEVVERSLAAWRAFSLALMEYRRGNYGVALDWCKRSLNYQRANAPREASVHLVTAMSLFQLNRADEARVELARCRQQIEHTFAGGLRVGMGGEGFWFDWVFARILLREANRLANEGS